MKRPNHSEEGERMDFKTMCLIEPRLQQLEQDIVQFRATRKRLGVCVQNDWYRQYKPRMYHLVGFGAENPELSSCECWDTAYFHLYDLLTDRKKKPLMC
jgi:hypothetical protein